MAETEHSEQRTEGQKIGDALVYITNTFEKSGFIHGTATTFSHNNTNYMTTAAHVILDDSSRPNGISPHVNSGKGREYYYVIADQNHNPSIARLIGYNADGSCENDNLVHFDQGSGQDLAVLEILDPEEDAKTIDAVLEESGDKYSKYEGPEEWTKALTDPKFKNERIQERARDFQYQGTPFTLDEVMSALNTIEDLLENGHSIGTFGMGFPGDAVQHIPPEDEKSGEPGTDQPALAHYLAFTEQERVNGNSVYNVTIERTDIDDVTPGYSGSAGYAFMAITQEGQEIPVPYVPFFVISANREENGVNNGRGVPIRPALDMISAHAAARQIGQELGVSHSTPSCHLAEGWIHDDLANSTHHGIPTPLTKPNSSERSMSP